MKSICLIIPYYGKFPNYFELWLKSVEKNSTIDFLLVTDIKESYDYPSNVKIKNMTFNELKTQVQSLYDFKISLDNPYRIVDFKVAYGELFYEYIKKYDFWGYCDVDLIFGDIRKFVTEEILNQYDKINLHGHFSLHKNCDEMRHLYKKTSKNIIDYKTAFKVNWTWHFDEYPGVSYICKDNDIKYIDLEDYADISWQYHNLCSTP